MHESIEPGFVTYMSYVSFRRFIAVLLMLWLPIQTAGAVVMPFCKYAQQGQAEAQASGTAHASHALHSEGCLSQADEQGNFSPDNSFSLGDDSCQLCHLACAGFVPTSAEAIHAFPVGAAVVGAHAPFRSVVPYVDHRPPLSASL